MNMKDYKAAWEKKYPDGKIEFGFHATAGYTTGLIIEKTLSVATSLDQLELRRAVFSLSGQLKTLDETFALDETGGQIGELTPLGGSLRSTSTATSSSSRSIRTKPPPASRSIRAHDALAGSRIGTPGATRRC